MFPSFLSPSRHFVFHESRFQKFHEDVRSGAFPEYGRFMVVGQRADGSSRVPTKSELREMLYGQDWELLSEKERAEKLNAVVGNRRGETRDEVQHCTRD